MSPRRGAGRIRSALRPVALAPPRSTSLSSRTGADRPAGGSSHGIIMSAHSTRRYLSLWLRRLSTDRIERHLQEQADAPRAVVASIKGAQRITALNDAAEALGLKVGLGLADARARYPSLPVVDA